MIFTIGLLSIFGSLHLPAWAGFQWDYLATARNKARVAFSIMFIISGIMHFTKTEQFTAMVPPFLPNPVMLVYISGLFEILGAIGLLIAVMWVRQTAVYATILLLLVIFPANIYAAVNVIVAPGALASPLYLWLRLPLQAFFIGWVWWAAGGKIDFPELQKSIMDYLRFQKMIAPVVLKTLFWPALAASIYYSIRLITGGLTVGWIPLIVGSLFVRVLFEGMLLFFSISEKLERIAQK